MKKLILSVAVLMITALPAFARDSLHLVCSGFMTKTPGPNNYGLNLIFDEFRGNSIDSRVEVLSSVWGTNLYQGMLSQTEGTFGATKLIELSSKEDSRKIFYKGTYSINVDAKGVYQLRLDGELNLQPMSSIAETQKVNTVLDCTNISN